MPTSSVKPPSRPAPKPAKGPQAPKAAPHSAAKSAPSGAATLASILDELKRRGTAQNVKVYRRQGAAEPLFGVSVANLDALAKKIGPSQELAAALWGTRNFDAMTLAAKIAQPETLTGRNLQDLIKSVNSHPISCSFAALAAAAPGAVTCIPGWIGARDELTRAAGYDTLAAMLKNGVDLSDEYLSGLVDTIEREIRTSPNRARYSMNGALIAIGGYRPSLRSRALAAAKRIGKVEVDHGDTSCKTPDAAAYIAKMAARKA
jgi:3-methyladenine DNA glycosylase AlkD